MAIGTGMGLLIGSLASGAATAAGARSAGRSARRAGDRQDAADERAFQLEVQRDAEARRQWEADQAFQRAQFDAQEEDRLFNRGLVEAREARAAPYREASTAALGRLRDLIGLNGGASNAGQQWRSPSHMGRPGTLGEMARRGY